MMTVAEHRCRRLRCWHGATLVAWALLIPTVGASASAGAQVDGPRPCIAQIRLASITCNRTADRPDARAMSQGEYYLRIDAGAELGPFELRTGESSTFSPGLLLDIVDTGILLPSDGEEVTAPISFSLTIREDDSTTTGEDDVDDRSVPLRVRERVGCSGSTTTLVRKIEIAEIGDGRAAARKPDVLTLSLKITSEK